MGGGGCKLRKRLLLGFQIKYTPHVSRGYSCEMGLRAISASEIELELKDKQVIALEAKLSGSDVFVPLPTGYGKSIIYALLPGSFDKLRG